MDGKVLQSVDLTLASGDPIEGLVSISQPPEEISPDEAAVIHKVASFHEVAYVFFRRFSDGWSSQPLAFVVDNTDERLSNEQLAKLHNDLWLHGVAPLVYVAWPTRIDILSCARGPDFWQADNRIYNPAFQLEVASEIASELTTRRRFSAYRLADGTFWDDPQNHVLANRDKAAHESLIRAIVETDQALDSESKPVLRRLLLLMVLIKYLEDREVFPDPDWFGQFHKSAHSFFDVLKSENPDSVIRLLQHLENKFNGDVFALPAETELTEESLRYFADLVESRTLSRQRYLWEQFSFTHLPVEVISHLYQRFVKGSTAIYTPPFLAALLLDYAMPYDGLSGKERVLDPACGSGVFLVGAFRRIVNIWRAKHEWTTPDVETLKSILREQIFGVELDAGAVDLTAFSLVLAVCDSLQPNVIWNELRFDRLRNRNLLEGDFFDYVIADVEGSLGKFDVVVGNPPFESEFSDAAKRVNAAYVTERDSIPDKQISYLFLDQGLRILTANGRLCLIQPAGFIYNLQSHPFRSAVAKTGRLSTILDFTSIRGLYDGADPKTIAIVAGEKINLAIEHLTFRRIYKTTQRIGFALDHYDRHRLLLDQLMTDSKAARANLLGGGRLCEFAMRLRQMRSLGQFIAERGWLMGEGFIEGTSGKQLGEHLTGQPFLPTRALTTSGFNLEDLETVESTHFYRPSRPLLFQPPLVLIREHESLPIAFWDQSVLTFKHKIVGIHAPQEESADLHRFYEFFQKHVQTYRFAIALNGSQALVGKATALLKSDIEALPLPEDEAELEFTFWEEILAKDVLMYIAPYVRLGQKSDLLKKSANIDVLHDYSSLFCRMLGSIFENLQAGEPVFLGGLICQFFFFGDAPAIEWLGPDCEEHLMNLVINDATESLCTIRVVRLYHKNVIFIFKPDRLRYWIRSTAIRDADDTLIELQQQGY